MTTIQFLLEPSADDSPQRVPVGLGHDRRHARRRPFAGPRRARDAMVAVLSNGSSARADCRRGRHGSGDPADAPPHRSAALSRRRIPRRQSGAGGNADRGRSGHRPLRTCRPAGPSPLGPANPGHAGRASRPATSQAHGRRPPQRLRGPRAAQLPAVDRRKRDGSAQGRSPSKTSCSANRCSWESRTSGSGSTAA